MHLDTDQNLLHHLVAADGTRRHYGVMGQHEVTSPMAVIMLGVATVVTLVSVMAMCVCRKKQADCNKEPGEPMLKEMTPIADKKTNHTAVTASSPVEDIDVHLTVDHHPNNRHSNGSVVMGKDHVDGGRPKSHDQRALPEIPAAGSLAGVMQTDDEDDDEGHYDIISRHLAMAASLSAASVSNSSASVSRGALNLYEKVGNANSDMSLVGATADGAAAGAAAAGTGTTHKNPQAENSGSNSRPNATANPYATVHGIGNADYARIDEQAKQGHHSTRGKAPGLRIQTGMDAQSAASTDTLTDSYVSVPPPPVPDKNFVNPPGSAEAGVSGMMSAPLTPNTLASISPQSSPGLPLRNSATMSSAEEAAALSVTAPLAAIAPSGDVVTVMELNAEAAAAAAATATADSTGKREPPYSSVTARESLANLRQRQAIERQQLKPLPHDATYESVNYDQITSPAVTNLNMMTSDRNSQASDLYAEIASGSGENSTRSSVYAKVGDVVGSNSVRETPAPTPPPLDFLKHLPKEATKSEEELPDPGYSIIRRARPASAYSSISTPPKPASPDPDDDPDSGDQPVYAVVDKSRARNRNTVCVSEDVNRNLNLATHHQSGETSIEQMYAQVNKQRGFNRVIPAPLDFPQALPASAYTGTGARPKVPRTNGNNNPVPAASGATAGAASTSAMGASNGIIPSQQQQQQQQQHARTSLSALPVDVDPAYQTIPNDVIVMATANHSVDPGYEDIHIHNQITELSTTGGASTAAGLMVSAGIPPPPEFDPNYECVHPAVVDSAGRMRLASPGVATEISASDMAATGGPNNPHGMVHINDHHVDSTFWQRREHVYQEIGTAQRQLARLDHHSLQISTDL